MSLVWHKAPRMFSNFWDAKHAGYLCLLGFLVTFRRQADALCLGEAPGAGKELEGLRWRLLSG